MRTLTCSVFKVPSHSFPGCDFIVAQFEAGPESLVDALCYAYLTHFVLLKRLFHGFQGENHIVKLQFEILETWFNALPKDDVIQ